MSRRSYSYSRSRSPALLPTDQTAYDEVLFVAAQRVVELEASLQSALADKRRVEHELLRLSEYMVSQVQYLHIMSRSNVPPCMFIP